MAEETTNVTTTQGAESTATEQQTAAAQGNNENAQSENKGTDFEALIQKAVDRATNKLGNDNKRLREENERLKKEKLSDDEIKKLEMQEQQKELDERDKALTEKENRWIAMQAIKEVGLDDGSKDSLAIVDFVMAEDEAGIKERVKAFNALVERIVKTKVDGVFKANGRTPGVGTDSAANAGGQNDSLAVRMGKNTAQTNKNAQSVLEHYIRR